MAYNGWGFDLLFYQTSSGNVSRHISLLPLFTVKVRQITVLKAVLASYVLSPFSISIRNVLDSAIYLPDENEWVPENLVTKIPGYVR